MQKKAMAVAVASALAAPGLALAQTSTVQIGGSLNLVYYHHNPNNPSQAKKGDILAQSEPNLFIQGEEKLGRGLSAWFRCESTFDPVLGSAGATGFCTRNSGIGLKGAFGNVFAGNWDLPAKDGLNLARGWWGGTAAFLGVSGNLLLNGAASGLTNPLSGSSTGAIGGSFFRRQASSWHYYSPVWNGFQVKAAFSATNETTTYTAANPLKPRVWSASAQYSTGPLRLAATYEQHTDYNPAGVAVGAGASQYNGGHDRAWTLAAGYNFAGVFDVRGIYTNLKYDATNSSELKARGWGVYADWRVQGPHTLRAQYAKLRDIKGNANVTVNFYDGNGGAGGTGAKTWAFAYSYAFSKRTEGSLVYRKVKQGRNTESFGVGNETATAGGGQTAWGLNFRHRF